MKDRLTEALSLVMDDLDVEQRTTIESVLRIYDEVSYMDYTDWEEFRNNGLETLVREEFNL